MNPPPFLTQQPQEGFSIDWSNPLARGLVVAVHPLRPSINLVDGSTITEAYGPAQSWRPKVNKIGRVVYNGPSTNYSLNSGSTSWVGNTAGATVAIVAIPHIAVTSTIPLLEWSGNGGWNTGSICMGDGTNPRWTAGSNATSGYQLTSAPDNYVLDKPYTVVSTTTANAQTLAINGAIAATSAYQPGNLSFNHMFNLHSPSGTQDAVEIGLILIWNRPLTPQDAVALSKNPWQIFARNSVITSATMAALMASLVSGTGTTGQDAMAMIGASSTQSGTSSGSAVSQTQQLVGTGSVQGSASPGAAIAQQYALAGSASSQASTSSLGAVDEQIIALGAPSFQSSSSASDAIVQAHALAGVGSSQASSSPGGELVAPVPAGVLAGVSSEQGSISSAGAVMQAHVLTGAASAQAAASSSAVLGQLYVLAGASLAQASTSGTGIVGEQFVAIGSPSFQSGASSAGAILQFHRPIGAASTQGSASPGGAARQEIDGVSREVLGIVVDAPTYTLSGHQAMQLAVQVSVIGGASQDVIYQAALGTISPDGVYTAPLAIGREQTDTITITPVAGKSLAVTLQVTVLAGLFNSWGLRMTLDDDPLIQPEYKEITEKQAKTGNYPKDHYRLYGLPIAIENPRGSIRRWKAADGTSGSQFMTYAYGYLEGTRGNDGDELDCTIGPSPLNTEMVYVVNQFLDGVFDEHKIMFGFPGQGEAEAGYLSNYEPGWRGMQSCIPCTRSQFKWWVANGDKTRPFEDALLPDEGITPMEKVIWDSANLLLPLRSTLDKVLYSIRLDDAADGLLYDAVSLADVLDDADSVLTFDALVIPFARIQQRMGILQKVLDRAGGDIKVAAMQVSDPFTQRGTTNVAVIYELTDGQTVSVFFHNPDTTPKKIMPSDELISWKWMLNKKDITVAVAPEKGRDLEVRIVAARIMMLAAKNSARFAQANSKRAEKLEMIGGLKAELETKQATLTDLQGQISAIEAERDAAGLVEPSPLLPTDEENAAIDRQIAALRERIDGMTNEQIYLVASILGISRPYNLGHDQLMEKIFSNHPDDVADAIKRWEATNAAAATLNVDDVKAVVTSADPMPGISRGSDWIVLNASRPLLGTETMSNGEFLDGRFYAAIDPRDSMAQAYFDEDMKLSASVVFVADKEALNTMALNTISPDSVGAYLEMDPEERDIALRGFVLRLNGRTYGDLQALAAKGMPVAPQPEPQPEPAVPDNVRKQVENALSRLREIAESVQAAKTLGGDGRYESEALANRKGEIEAAQATLAKFRASAPANGIDAEAFIASLGGEPDLTPSADALAWEGKEAEAKAAAEAAAAAAAAAAAEAAAQAQRDAEAAAAAEKAAKEAQEAQESDDGDFLAAAAAGNVDFYDKAVTDRLAVLARTYTDPEGAYLDMVMRAKTAAKNFFIAEFKKKVS